jgi:hypothetical protein
MQLCLPIVATLGPVFASALADAGSVAFLRKGDRRRLRSPLARACGSPLDALLLRRTAKVGPPRALLRLRGALVDLQRHHLESVEDDSELDALYRRPDGRPVLRLRAVGPKLDHPECGRPKLDHPAFPCPWHRRRRAARRPPRRGGRTPPPEPDQDPDQGSGTQPNFDTGTYDAFEAPVDFRTDEYSRMYNPEDYL